MKIYLYIIILIFLILIGIISHFIFLNLYSNTPVVNQGDINKSEIGIEQVNYVLISIGASGLHNPPFSSNTPKIEINIGQNVYNSEVIDSNIHTTEGPSSEPDLRIIISENEFIGALNSDPKTFLQKSVSEGRTNIEIISNKITLFSKGYLELYKQVTGETLTGSIIKNIK